MADDRVDGLLQSLGATFDAAVAREEEEAAADLAMSLRQGRSFADVLVRSSWRATLDPGSSAHVEAVGRDFVIANGLGRHVIPMTHVEVAPSETGARPERIASTLVETLRDVARAGRGVDALSQRGEHSGVLRWVGPDHLALEGRRGLVLIPLAALLRVTVHEREEPR